MIQKMALVAKGYKYHVHFSKQRYVGLVVDLM